MISSLVDSGQDCTLMNHSIVISLTEAYGVSWHAHCSKGVQSSLCTKAKHI